MVQAKRLLIGGQWVGADGRKEIPVLAPYDGSVLATVPEATREDVDQAVARALEVFRTRPLPPQERFRILSRTSALIESRAEELARTIAQEAGKPIREARIEVSRAVQTFQISAEEAKRIHGEGVPVEAAPGSENRLAFTLRVPIGPVCAISPFNFPLNLVAHKVGPALAAGNPVVLKPATATPLVALRLGELLEEAGLPPGYLSIVVGSGRTVGEQLLTDPRFSLYSFTGSPEVGQHLRERIGLRRAILELGSNSATVIHEDADLERAAPACTRAGFAYAGQVCISLQRLFLHEAIAERFLGVFLPAVEALRVGDPLDEATDVGPMIDEESARRAQAWIQEAVDRGARILVGGRREGNRVWPTVLTEVDPSLRVVCFEVFAPVVVVETYRDLEEVIRRVNDSRYGLQAGIFTRDLQVAWRFARAVEVGGVIINDTCMYRADLMPYGGVKMSGIGREGPRYAIEEMTDVRVVVFNL